MIDYGKICSNLKGWLLFPVFLLCGMTGAQTYLYFQDSPSEEYYEYSWMEVTPPSELDRKGTDQRRFPVESVASPVQGLNSLRLKWKSEPGGTWVAIAAGTNWTEKDISNTDTMLFWLQSVDGLGAENLPLVFVEDVANVKSIKHDFSSWCDTLPAGQWTRIAIPMDFFLDAGDPVDFTRIKTIGFAQHTDDQVEHTLYIDNMKVFSGSGTSTGATPPSGLIAGGYDSHIELRWNPNPEAYVTGYEIQRSVPGGLSFITIGLTDQSKDTIFVDHVRELGTTVTASYRVSALNGSGEPSVPSDTVSASTRVFSDEELLDMVERYTFRYFWDFAEPNSGLVGDRNTSGNQVTTGGSGFGIMAVLTGIERGFITRELGIRRMDKILTFLETADRFHGVWPHILDGTTGKTVPFSGAEDNGGDLVETGFLMEGLLTARQYFNRETAEEQSVVRRITDLWISVEWDWYRKNGSDVLYWHWSPDYGWAMNLQVRGWNETAIVYILAIASPTHHVPASLWHTGYAGSPYYRNGKTFYGYTLDVGWDRGGPLFFAHYSFLGFDPRNKKDAYTNYFRNNRNHTLINRAYCMDNPLEREGYGENCWGLTASDDPDGYRVHEPYPGYDNGTITPTAALSSMPYTPEESLGALKYMYRELGKKVWGPMGFYDAFNQGRSWYADSYLAIDQGPIIGMIENFRSQLLWNNFMANTEIQQALDDIGFTEDLTTGITGRDQDLGLVVMPNPIRQQGIVRFYLKDPHKVSLYLYDLSGRRIATLASDAPFPAGENLILLESNPSPGLYYIKLDLEDRSVETKVIFE